MQQIRKISKNQGWFKEIVEKCKLNLKNVNPQFKDEQNKYSKGHFYALLCYISSEAELKAPTKEQASELFDQFNEETGKNIDYLEKDQFDKFCIRLFEMLEAAKEA